MEAGLSVPWVLRCFPYLSRLAVLFCHSGPASGVYEGGVCLSGHRSEEHTSELQSLREISYAVFCLKNKRFLIGLCILVLLVAGALAGTYMSVSYTHLDVYKRQGHSGRV